MRSLSRRLLFRVFAPEGEILSFAPPKESIQRKGGSIAASSCAPRFCRGVGREGFLPSYRRAASIPRPFGLIPTKPAVLGAANETKATYCVTANNTYTLGIKLSFSTTLSPNSAVEIMVTPVPGFERSAVE